MKYPKFGLCLKIVLFRCASEASPEAPLRPLCQRISQGLQGPFRGLSGACQPPRRLQRLPSKRGLPGASRSCKFGGLNLQKRLELGPFRPSSNLATSLQRSYIGSIQDQAFRGNWGPRAKPKAKPSARRN